MRRERHDEDQSPGKETSHGSVAKREMLFLFILLGIFLAFLVPALSSAQKEDRDGVRRAHLLHIKQALEQYNNVAEIYPVAPTKPQTGCATSADTNDWFFGAENPLFDEELLDAFPRDPRAEKGHPYLYCVIETDGERAIAWYLRARLERQTSPRAGFDDEYNIFFRVTHEQGKTLYDICGGTLRCGEKDGTRTD